MERKRIKLSDLPGLNNKDGYIRVEKSEAGPASRPAPYSDGGKSGVYKKPVVFSTDEGFAIIAGKENGGDTCRICGEKSGGYVICGECREKYGDKIKEAFIKALDEGKSSFTFEI